ncbi:PD-(D/E)XK nuclease family transposase [Candidatus Parabeggiatoa sp. HSG14]|uniref:PD-(D/E)XK nuclease family transposase n=1 Tax=Candidatus Parabeggiatoa sp. HSG14 TaxID=3055593 RepID=UPI0032E3FBFC
MQFIDVRTDFAFKKVFGSRQSKDILISLLNALLDFGNNSISDEMRLVFVELPSLTRRYVN